MKLSADTGATSKPARAFGDDQAFGRQPVQQFAQRADADAVGILERFEPELLRRRQAAENDVVAQAPVGLFAGGLDARSNHSTHLSSDDPSDRMMIRFLTIESALRK